MAKQEDAKLILELYALRREAEMRKARTWFVREFHPSSLQAVLDVLAGERSAWLRMITSYWEMAATLVVHGAIDAQMFNESNGEHVLVFAKIEPFLADLRKQMGNPKMNANLEQVVRAMPNADALLKSMRERLAAMAQAAVAR